MRKSSAPSVAKCYERKRARGLARIPVWIPDTPEARRAIQAEGKRLREEHEKKGTQP